MPDSFRIYLEQKAHISAEQFKKLGSTITERSVKKGTLLLKQEEICSEVYFVSGGLLRAYTVDESGKEHIIQFAPEGWWISDRNSFLFHEPSLFFIDAIEDSELVVLKEPFFAAASAIPAFNDFNTHALHNLIRQQQHRISLLIGASAEQRYMDFISRYPSLTLRVPQWMIASYLGITPESLSRVRKELARKNFRPSAR